MINRMDGVGHCEPWQSIMVRKCTREASAVTSKSSQDYGLVAAGNVSRKIIAFRISVLPLQGYQSRGSAQTPVPPLHQIVRLRSWI